VTVGRVVGLRTAVLDSAPWRRLAGSAVGSRVLASDPYLRIDMLRRSVRADRAQRREPHRFDGVAGFLLFIGHTKSGGSLLGALIDAHPNAVVADETDVIQYSEAGFARHQIFDVLVRGAEREAAKGRVTARRIQPYSLAVPGQWQGRHEAIRVIGDSRAGPTTRRIADDPAALERLQDVLGGIPIHFIQVVRNPIDPMSAMILRSGRSTESAITDYFDQCERLAGIRSRLGSAVHTVHYEDFVEGTLARLRSLCGVLGLDVDDSHLLACTSLVDPSRQPESSRVPWTRCDLDRISEMTARFDFLERYAHVG
jgi:hypothetical protein